ncbi:hypothetical protein LUZ63_011408 [Rhynchospora breviuscula]|uniref:F-box domain-containing protein n=1 Tax=Rhynchospora breviuscula TaxID=2022672 RepID=A0A9Q0HQZ6_9POAL|nr:hypothetical protein LUZ63_011408 [Rhynchospora breviuscula]
MGLTIVGARHGFSKTPSASSFLAPPVSVVINSNKMPRTEVSSCSKFRDWAHLPPEIVELISSKVKSTTDYVRFRAVCSPWRSACDPKPRHHLPPQLPWLMLPYNLLDPTWIYFDDVWESKRRKFYIPEAKGMVYCASYRGWFLLADHGFREVFLLNPLTQTRIQLPSFSAPVKRLRDDSFGWFINVNCSITGTKVTFSSDLTDPNCLITVLLSRYTVICCRVGDLYWTRVNYNVYQPLDDVTYYNGRFYLLYKESMKIIESDKPDERIVPMTELEAVRKCVRKCFLEGKSGIYVLAVHPQEKFVLYQFLEEPLILKQIANTSNNIAIFYRNNYPCLTVCADDWESLDGSSVYMENKCVPNASKSAAGSHYSIYSAKWDGQKIEHMVHDLGKEPQFRPGEPVMWFQPSFV